MAEQRPVAALTRNVHQGVGNSRLLQMTGILIDRDLPVLLGTLCPPVGDGIDEPDGAR